MLNTFPDMTRFDIFLAPPGQYICAIDVRGPLPALDILDFTLAADKDCRCPQKNDGFIWWISGWYLASKKVSGSDNLRHSVEAQPRMGSAKMLKRCFGYLKRCQATTGKLRPNRKGAAVPMGKCLKCWHFRTNNQTIWQFSAMQLSKVTAAKWIGTSTNPQN